MKFWGNRYAALAAILLGALGFAPAQAQVIQAQVRVDGLS